MNVVRLVEFANRDTVATLRCLLAQAISGEIVGMACCFKTKEGLEDSAFTGLYKTGPAAVNATMRLSWKLTQMQDPVAGPQ